jgi:hypothetical protein
MRRAALWLLGVPLVLLAAFGGYRLLPAQTSGATNSTGKALQQPDQQIAGPPLWLEINRDAASRRGLPGDR